MRYDIVRDQLLREPRRFLVTGAAGFIGSNLVATLIDLGQSVVAMDNLQTGHRRNVESAAGVSPHLTFVEGDIRDPEACMEVCRDVDIVLHQAALGSVPRSILDPQASHASNVNGFLNILNAVRERSVGRLVYASSSSVYGDHAGLPKVEHTTGKLLSPYALTKAINEQYAEVFARTYKVETIGLRYFNVFGRRQDPDGPYAAVIPKWIALLLSGKRVEIFGDGETSRDFCYVENAVQANILAALSNNNPEALNTVYNVACGARTSLNQLYRALVDGLVARNRLPRPVEPLYRDFRTGDIRHSLADISRAHTLLGYEPIFSFEEGLEQCIDWYCENFDVHRNLNTASLA